MSVQENGSQEEPCDLMASGLGGSGLSTEIKEPLLASDKDFVLNNMNSIKIDNNLTYLISKLGDV